MTNTECTTKMPDALPHQNFDRRANFVDLGDMDQLVLRLGKSLLTLTSEADGSLTLSLGDSFSIKVPKGLSMSAGEDILLAGKKDIHISSGDVYAHAGDKGKIFLNTPTGRDILDTVTERKIEG